MQILLCGANTSASKLANVIVKTEDDLVISAVGVQAINKACKALAIANKVRELPTIIDTEYGICHDGTTKLTTLFKVNKKKERN